MMAKLAWRLGPWDRRVGKDLDIAEESNFVTEPVPSGPII